MAGPLEGRRLLHLQCNSGQDTLSLVRRGALALGVDISDEAIHFAQRLSADSGLHADFLRADVFDYLAEAGARGDTFDVVFSTYGALPWLSDLRVWAKGVAGVLAPGGRVVLVEFHPVAFMFDEDLRHKWPYASAAPEHAPGVGDYVALSGATLTPSGYVEGEVAFQNPEPCVEHFWGLGDVFGALLGAGLRLERFEEYPFANGCKIFHSLRATDGNRYVLPEGVPPFPLMYGVVATRP